jgi:ribosomal protein S27AE
MPTNVGDESRTLLRGKPRHTGNFGRRDLAPEEIIRVVKERYRISNYLSGALAFWILGAAAVASGLQITEPHSGRNGTLTLPFVVLLVGTAMSACILAVKFALYRCPVCDKNLIGFHPDKFHCPRCGAQVKEPA